MTQAISYGLTTAEKARRFAMEPAETTELAFPMTSDRTTARMNLVSGLLDDVAYNAARKVENVSLYEQGRVFLRDKDNDRPREVEHVAGALTGLFRKSTWHDDKLAAGFYLAKELSTSCSIRWLFQVESNIVQRLLTRQCILGARPIFILMTILSDMSVKFIKRCQRISPETRLRVRA